ncbi:MAG: thioredoxin family protein [Pseudomonadales bacterium]|nr:thioredoxin family protein [Pseudomonadales bacterium]
MRMLYVFKSPSCAACIEAEPFLAAFEKENRARVPVIRLNPFLRNWNIAGFAPDSTPSYAMVERSGTTGAQLLGKVEGRILTLEELRSFVENPEAFGGGK